MNASVALNAARAAGIRISIDAGDLVLEATAPPPQDVLDLLRRHKTSIVTLLGVGHDGWTAEDWQVLLAERAAHFEFDCGLPRGVGGSPGFRGLPDRMAEPTSGTITRGSVRVVRTLRNSTCCGVALWDRARDPHMAP